MDVAIVKSFLLWCALFNMALVLLWFGAFVFLGDWIYRMHGRWFKLSREQFDGIFYGLLGLYKLGIFMFNIVPWLALLIIG